jgi:preprotein translocase subunit Sss1
MKRKEQEDNMRRMMMFVELYKRMYKVKVDPSDIEFIKIVPIDLSKINV